MSIKKKLKAVGLTLALSITTAFAKDKAPILTANNDAKTHKTEISASRTSTNDNKTAKAFFTAKEVAKAVHSAGLSQEEATAFLNDYMSNLDERGFIAAKGLMDSFKKNKLDNKQASCIFESLTNAANERLYKNDLPSPNQKVSEDGYDFGSYSISFSIGKQGQISSMNMRGTRPDMSNDFKTINEAVCRHTGQAVDRMTWEIEASQFIDEVLIYNIIKEKTQQEETIPNADKYIERFQKKIEQNGLEFRDDGKLHGIESSKNKPLKTEKQLQAEFMKKQQQEFNTFRNER